MKDAEEQQAQQEAKEETQTKSKAKSDTSSDFGFARDNSMKHFFEEVQEMYSWEGWPPLHNLVEALEKEYREEVLEKMRDDLERDEEMQVEQLLNDLKKSEEALRERLANMRVVVKEGIWVDGRTEDGADYYFNTVTQELSWSMPESESIEEFMYLKEDEVNAVIERLHAFLAHEAEET